MVIEFNPDIKENTGVWLPDGDALMKWAREQAPSEPSPCGPYVSGRRRVRLEISAELCRDYSDSHDEHTEHVMANVYLVEPRCSATYSAEHYSINCECDPLAERRIK